MLWKKINYNDQLVATLLKLSLTGHIKITEDNISILKEDNLSKSEQLFILFLKGRNIYSNKYISTEIYFDNIQDCMDSDLFIKEKTSIEKLSILINFFSVILWILSLIINSLNMFFSPILIFCFFILNFVIAFIMDNIGKYNKQMLIRNEKGLDVQKKLIGLKNFLKDFSNISDKSIDDIYNWEYYIIYAIIFNSKGKLNKESDDLYNKYLKKLMYIKK